MTTTTFADWVTAKRERKGWSQGQLADRIGVSRQTMSAIERGKIALPNADIRRSLAQAFEVSHLDVLVAAGEINADEIRTTAARGVDAVDPNRQALIDRLMRVALRDDRYDLLESILDRYIRLDRKAAEAVQHPADEGHHDRIVRAK